VPARGRRAEYVKASDGLIARNSGIWAKEKLSFLDEYGPPALKATEAKRQRWYVDLFAGPGINVDDEETHLEFEGAALRALKMTAPGDERVYFTHMVLVNKDIEAHQALEFRINRHCDEGHCRAPRAHVHAVHGDSNRLTHSIMRKINAKSYVFVFADIEAPKQLPFSTVRALMSHGHKSVDLFVLFPLDMGLNRVLSYNPETWEASAETLTEFFGTDKWRQIVEDRVTEAQSKDLRRRVLELYMEQLRKDWQFVHVVRDVKRQGATKLYKMLFATNHRAGKKISEWSAAQPRKRDQLDLLG
jgi:three-Cys-motif partner protein